MTAMIDRRGALALAGSVAACAGAPDLMAAVTRADGHARNLLWYAQPANEWVEALPVGNGRIGAMIFGGIAHERIQLNEDTLWGGGPYDPVNPKALAALPDMRRRIFAGDFDGATALAKDSLMAVPLRQMSYQALGDLFIEMDGIDPAGVTAYRRHLDIDAALSGVRFTAGGVTFRREVVASPDDQLIAIHISADRPGRIGFDLRATTPQKAGSVTIADDGAMMIAGRNNMDNGVPGALRFEARVSVQAGGGAVTRGADRLSVRGANEATILIAMATSYRRFDDGGGDPSALNRATLDQAAGKRFATIAAGTAKAHRALFRRVQIDLGSGQGAGQPTDQRIRQSEKADDPALAALYFQYGRYLLICSSRPGSQPANLQGIWNESTRPPWGSKYTININTQMNYWPAEPIALPEMTEPLIAMVRDLAVTGARTARSMYGARGWVCHHNTDLWRATAPIDGPQFGLWPTGGAWLCLHLWDRYDYGRDRAYLASIYPILLGASLFFLDTLVPDPRSGWMVTNPSLSPENNHGHGTSLCAGPTMDMQIIRDLFANTAAAARILAQDAELVAQIDAMRARLAPSRVGSQGQLMEWQEDWDAGANDIHHRHVSHLYGLYPSAQIHPETTPELAAAARRSLEIRGDKATGWATAWRINLWARLRDGDRAHAILRFLLGPERTYPNMFDAHPPFQIDGNFGGAAGIAEMLMQSMGDDICLLPALPSAWPRGSITGLRARGGVGVDLRWDKGALVEARLTPSLAGERTVRCGDCMRTIRLTAGRPITLRGAALA
jgi:alpha-L-fucosidase 2